MNFDWLDLNWFLSIPGMLITGGILLIIMAIIIFITAKDTSDKGNFDHVNTNSYQKIKKPLKEESTSQPISQAIDVDDIDKKLEELAKNGFNKKLDNLSIEPANNEDKNESKQLENQNILSQPEEKVILTRDSSETVAIKEEKSETKPENRDLPEKKVGGLALTEINLQPVSIYEPQKEVSNQEKNQTIEKPPVQKKSDGKKETSTQETKRNNQSNIEIPVIVNTSEPKPPVAQDIETL